MPKRRLGRSAPDTATNGLLYPLDAAYSREGVEQPVVNVIAPAEIPPPYRSLLVHERAMTLTLEDHFGGPVRLRPLSVFAERRWYFRRVLLVQEYSGRPVEMGAIRLDLHVFDTPIRRAILAKDIPLGRLLRDGGVDYKSLPKAFLAIMPNAEMMGVFWMREPRRLYGRRTEVLLHGAKIGDIVEVLPPV